MFKDYKKVIPFLFERLPMYQRQGSTAFKKDLKNILSLCQLLSNPQLDYKSIHIAGTNGKGTVSHLIQSAMMGMHLKTGIYTSPHYKDFRERIKIDGKYISRHDVVAFVNLIYDHLDEIDASFFEITVAMAFWYFKRQDVDYAIIETGLGGRLDSTNVVKPIISIITNISLDHQAMLGDTVELIAKEKAGIIKQDTPVLIGERQEEVADVFVEYAKNKNAELVFQDEILTQVQKEKLDLIKGFDVPFQKKNLYTAAASIRYLEILGKLPESNFDDHCESFARVFDRTNYFGRWQQIGTVPKIIADGAHNEAAIQLVIDKLAEESYRKIHFVLGFVNDKNIEKILIKFPKEALYYFAKADIPRGLNAKKLKEKANGLDLKGRAYVSVKNALKAAKRNAEKGDLIYVGGSIFVVAEVL